MQRVCEVIELGWPGSVKAGTRDGYTPLIGAIESGHTGTIKALLAART